MESIAIAFIFTVVLATSSGASIWDRAILTCNAQRSSSIDSETRRDFSVDSSCSDGKVKWYYSSSYINLHFDKQCSFTVCFSSNSSPMWRKYSVMESVNGANMYVGSPSRGNDVCISSSGGKLDITIVPEHTFYALDVNFRVSATV